MRIITLFLALFLLLPVLSAEIVVVKTSSSPTFQVTADHQELLVCTCATNVGKLLITNLDSSENTVVLTHDQPGKVLLSSNRAVIPVGRSAEISYSYQATCDEEATAITFYLVDSKGHQQSLTIPVSVTACANLEASLVTTTQTPITPCSPVDYQVWIRNTGGYDETYTVTSDYEGFSEADAVLNILPGAVGVMNATFVPDCSISGDLTIPITVTSTTSELEAHLEHQLTILPDYDYEVLADDFSLCADAPKPLFIEVINNASLTNTINLSLSAPSWITLKENSVTLEPGAKAQVEINVSDKPHMGDTSLTIAAKSRYGDVTALLNRQLHVERCYDLTTTILADTEPVWCSGYHSLPVKVVNTGAKNVTAELTLQNTTHATLSEDHFEIAAGQEKELTLHFTSEAQESGAETIVVENAIGDRGVVSQDSIEITYLSNQECYQPFVTSTAKLRITDNELIVPVTNIGMQGTEFLVSYNGLSWLKLDENKSSVYLSPGEEKNLYFIADATSQDIGVHETVVYLYTVIDDEVYTYAFPLTITLADKPWSVLVYEYYSERPCQLVSSLLILLIVIGLLVWLLSAIGGRRSTISWSRLAIIVLSWAIIVLLVLTVTGGPKPLFDKVVQGDDPLTISFAQDTSFTLNLSNYFVDPDQDVLEFFIPSMENVSVDVINDSATFTPKNHWSGEKRLRIIAVDKRGGIAESSRMSLVVVPRPTVDFWYVHDRYCTLINLFLVLLVVLAWCPIFSSKVKIFKEKESKKEPVRRRGRPKKKV